MSVIDRGSLMSTPKDVKMLQEINSLKSRCFTSGYGEGLRDGRKQGRAAGRKKILKDLKELKAWIRKEKIAEVCNSTIWHAYNIIETLVDNLIDKPVRKRRKR